MKQDENGRIGRYEMEEYYLERSEMSSSKTNLRSPGKQ